MLQGSFVVLSSGMGYKIQEGKEQMQARVLVNELILRWRLLMEKSFCWYLKRSGIGVS